MYEIPTRKRHLLWTLESPRSNREKKRTEWSVQQLPQTGMASQLHPPPNGKAEKQQGSQRAAFSPPLRSILSMQPASQPTAAAHRSALHRPTCLQLFACCRGAHGERFSSFFLWWWWWPAVRPLSVPGWLPTSPRDEMDGWMPPDPSSRTLCPSVPLPTGYSDAGRRGVPKQIAAVAGGVLASSGPVGLEDCSERRDRPGKAGKT